MTGDESLRKHILSLNEAWQSGDFERLAGFYHPDVVLLPPDAGEPIVGCAAVIASYQDFAQAATLHEFQVTSLETFRYPATAVCHMRFEIDYEVRGGRFREAGLEVYVLNYSASNSSPPLIVWRGQSLLEAVEVIPNDTSN